MIHPYSLKQVSCHVPGKLMLSGEYQVLRGGAALACTISADLVVNASVNPEDQDVIVASSAWDLPVNVSILDRFDLRTREPLVQAANYCRTKHGLTQLNLSIDTDIDVSYGAGTSSAIRFGVLSAVDRLIRGNNSGNGEPSEETYRWDVAYESYELQKKAQKQASGYDIVTQNLGGPVLIEPMATGKSWPGLVVKIRDGSKWLNRFVTPYINGRGAMTRTTIPSVVKWLDSQESRWPTLAKLSEVQTRAFAKAIAERDLDYDWRHLRSAIQDHLEFMAKGPASHSRHKDLTRLDGYGKDWMYKTTGAGGDDSILVFSDPEYRQTLREQLSRLGLVPAPFEFSETGMRIEGAH